MSGIVKCLVWDLDNTIWDGTLIEGDGCVPKPGIYKILTELENRGILQSIASANDSKIALKKLKDLDIYGYFLCPQIDWSNKVSKIKTISRTLGISLDSIGFIDDERYEIEQVRHLLPEVRTYLSSVYKNLPDRPEFRPRIISEESGRRKLIYAQENKRKRSKADLGMSHKEFLKWCGTEILVRPGTKEDIPRTLELMHRTHQLNATGILHSERKLRSYFEDPSYRIFIARLKDRFVDYGKIGVGICRVNKDRWRLVSFMLSCRVLSRGISGFYLSWILRQAYESGASILEAVYYPRHRNGRMLVLFKFAGFKHAKNLSDGKQIWVKKGAANINIPEWLTVKEELIP